MTSSILDQWLVPQKLSNGWKFQCSSNLRELVASNHAGDYFRSVFTLIDEEYHLENFHFKIQHHRKVRNHMEIFFFFGDDQIKQAADPVAICSSCDINHELSRTTLLSEHEHTYAWLDFRNRPKLIITPKRHLERLSDLRDENGEMNAFWSDIVQVIDRECDQIDELNYPTLAINQGTFRKHAHLHLKIDIPKDYWETTIALRHKDKLEYLAQLLKQTALISDCFTEKHLQKEIQKGVIGNSNEKAPSAIS